MPSYNMATTADTIFTELCEDYIILTSVRCPNINFENVRRYTQWTWFNDTEKP